VFGAVQEYEHVGDRSIDDEQDIASCSHRRLPEGAEHREQAAGALARALAGLATTRHPVVLASIDGAGPEASPLAPFLRERGFEVSSRGLIRRWRADG
jgi:hypothetical protein